MGDQGGKKKIRLEDILFKAYIYDIYIKKRFELGFFVISHFWRFGCRELDGSGYGRVQNKNDALNSGKAEPGLNTSAKTTRILNCKNLK